ncbi:Atp-binding cassette sub-family g member [Thalictrum thalictroides]|uniref:Atp-binding cassette sub-family g member n=1 Tax=Thalictrum thalictroides TaxID=46969 RepID=A0A7J6V0C8_THATH|nr:Atp-binding cassette sub-family g member [Thalictrum thalictroides]
MPGLPQRNVQFTNAYPSTCLSGSISTNGIWSKHRDEISFDQLQKFWSELPAYARQELLRIDKQTLLEQARKNLYCSRCNGLLLEGFTQIVIYGKSLQQEGGTTGIIANGRMTTLNDQSDNGSDTKTLACQDDTQDPSVHPWGGLVATREGILTLLDCFLEAKSLKALQNVFDSARVRERERELLYPDACGGGGRGWISQGAANYGRGHGTRETCALHTARLSCDTLVDFWSALGDETRRSLLRMKEEDFIERLMYRFDSKRFCRDCRRNVIREFKELKELKRMRREPRCTSWFCAADTAFQYEVSDDMVLADWHQSFTDTFSTYHHFEWGFGTGEGKSDILEFEDVGMNGSVQVNGLDLGDLNACFITLRAWKLDGRCTELSVKAHAMKGQACVHRRLVVGDGYVTITKGESIRRFFEHAEEAEEEEDDESMDKDGNDMDGEGSRPQKHAKSPELAREFLLDAATVIFKEQVEKAFREGTARQNAHCIFVCLALKLLEERIHVACKEIITLEKQTKLLEEEEREKRDEEERKERRRTKEREKKMRRKERLKGKERQREDGSEMKHDFMGSEMSKEESSPSVHEESNNSVSSEDSVSEIGDTDLPRPHSPDIQEEQSSSGCINSEMQNLKSDSPRHTCNVSDGEVGTMDSSGSFVIEQSKSSRRKLRFQKEFQFDPASKWCDKRKSAINDDNGSLVDEYETRSHGGCMSSRSVGGVNRQYRNNFVKSNSRISSSKFNEKFHCTNNRMRERCDLQSYNCSFQSDYQARDERHISTMKTCREDSASDVSRTFYRNNKYNHGCYLPDTCGVAKSKLTGGNFPQSRDMLHTKKVWEPLDLRKKYPRSNSDSDVTLRSSSLKTGEGEEGRCNGDDMGSQPASNTHKLAVEPCLYEINRDLDKVGGKSNYENLEGDCMVESRIPCLTADNTSQRGSGFKPNESYSSKEAGNEEPYPVASSFLMSGTDPIRSGTSSSDNCSSCLSEGDSSTGSSGTQNAESWPTSDSEESSQQLEGKEASTCGENGFQKISYDELDDKHKTNGGESLQGTVSAGLSVARGAGETHIQGDLSTNRVQIDGRIAADVGSQQHHMIPPMFNQGIHLPMIPAPSTMAYYQQSPTSWSPGPVSGLTAYHQPNHYLFTAPLRFGMSANQPSHLCMQYNALQPVPTSILNAGQHPVYQTVSRGTVVNTEEQNGNSKFAQAPKAANGFGTMVREIPADRPVVNGQTSPQEPSHRDNGSISVSSNLRCDNANFSLFHFGGPIAVASGSDMNAAFPREGAVKDRCSYPPAQCTQPGLSCSNKDSTVEEYSLFAASNGTRFSFF